MAKNDVLELAGLTDLQKKLSFVTKNYPDESEKLLTLITAIQTYLDQLVLEDITLDITV